MDEQISPSSVLPLMTQQQPSQKGEAMQGWTELREPAGFEVFVWRLSWVASNFPMLVFVPLPKTTTDVINWQNYSGLVLGFPNCTAVAPLKPLQGN